MRVDVSGWPGIAIHLTAQGEIIASNGHLETLLGIPVVGRRLLDILDDGPSADKWRLLLEAKAPATFEVIFSANDVSTSPRAFSLLPAGDDELAVVEHPAHPRLNALAAEVEATNSDLATAQRALVIERARLAAALKELERSNTALDEFAHAVSHDLKAPLRAMKDSGEILKEPAVAAADREQHAQRVIDLVGRMRRMIDGVFEYARAGRSGGVAESIDTRRAVLELVEYLEPPPSIRVLVDDSLPVILGERVPFDQVFRNLLSNAFTYRRAEGALVRVSGTARGDFLEISVSDNGPGISTAQQARIWRLFHTSRPGEGTGIGLAVVRRLVEAQGGSIEVDSIPDAGSTFRVRWPMTPRQPRRVAVAE